MVKKIKIFTLSLLLFLFSLVILTGYSYGWFTDQITSYNNVIKTGSIKSDLTYCSDRYCAIEDKFENVLDKQIYGTKLWKPSDFDVKYFKVRNIGSLPFVYTFNLIGNSNCDLSKYLQVYIKSGKEEVLDFNPDLAHDLGFTYVGSLNQVFYSKLNLVENSLISPNDYNDFMLILYLDKDVDTFLEDYTTDPFEVVLSTTQVMPNKNYYVSSVDDLLEVVSLVNSGQDSFKDKIVILKEDIDLAYMDWQPIGSSEYPFKGSFDGSNKTIKNFFNYNDDLLYVGLFGQISGQDSFIKDLKIDKVSLKGQDYVGALAGKIENATVSNITVSNVSITGSSSYTGGVIGYLDGSILDSKVTGVNISLEKKPDKSTYSFGVGGMVGYLNNKKSSPRNLSASKVYVVGGSSVGGLIGHSINLSFLSDCFVEKVASSGYVWAKSEKNPYVGGLIGYADKIVNLSNCHNHNVLVENSKKDYKGLLIGSQ